MVSSLLPVARSANRARSDGPFMSVRMARGARQLTRGRRKNVPGEVTLPLIADSTSCWRRARSMSVSFGAQLFLRMRA